MPAETVYGDDGVNVRVAWGTAPHGEVQIATLAVETGEQPDPTQRLIETVNNWLSDAGEPMIDLAKLRLALPYTPSFDGWHAQLKDWASVNRLIGTLRKARDRQFGPPN